MQEPFKLDIGCGTYKHSGFIGMDKRDVEGVDIVHDFEIFPWPIHDDSVFMAIASHVLEHVKPWLTVDFINEIWRVMLTGSNFAAAVPYPGSRAYFQDPTHCSFWSEVTFQYFDPRYPLYEVYEPKPWKIKKGFPVYQSNGSVEVIMEKLPLDHGLELMYPSLYPAKEKDELKDKAEEPEAKDESGPTLGISVSEKIKMKEVIG